MKICSNEVNEFYGNQFSTAIINIAGGTAKYRIFIFLQYFHVYIYAKMMLIDMYI